MQSMEKAPLRRGFSLGFIRNRLLRILLCGLQHYPWNAITRWFTMNALTYASTSM